MKHISRRSMLKLAGTSTLAVGASGAGTFAYASHIEPGWVEVTSIPLPIKRLPTAFHGYRILQLSDIHIDNTWMDQGRVEEIVELANQQHADLIVITGDFITRRHLGVQQALQALRHLRAKDGVIGIFGNHDYWTNISWVRQIVESAGVMMLVDNTHTIQHGDARLHFIGMDDLWTSAGDRVRPPSVHKGRLDALIAELPEGEPIILLVHEPDFADVAAASGRIAVELSGHSHGGQVRLPFYGPLILPSLGRRYPIGMYTINSMIHYTSRGLGMVPPQVRINCRPEIPIFECRGV